MFERSARNVRINIGPNWVPTCNFALINTEGMEAFAREQSKLLSPDLIASTTDYRGAVIGAWRLVWLEEPD